jgi:predicted acylesterase/phospholipase RssA
LEDEVFAFRDLNPYYSPSLAEAVRASANFPFGFPLVEVATTHAYGTPYVEGKLAKLTDGGVLSNSGMWTLFHLLTRQSDVVAKLKKRGVLLLVVDASHMPEYSDSRRDLLSLYSAIGDQAPIAQNLHRRMFEYLQKEYGRRLSIVQLDIPPTPADNVLTTWALDNESKRKLRRSFCRMWRHGDENSLNAGERIKEHWNYLANGGPKPDDVADAAGAALPFAVVRPPLD